jgi:hypothetical protein
LGMKHPFQWKYLIAAVGLVLLVILVMDFNQRLDSMNRLDTQLATVRVEGTRVMQTQVALMTEVAYAGSDAAAKEWAYQNGLRGPGETLIQIIPGGTAMPTAAPPAVVTTPELQNWQVWWELFFGN